MSDANLSDDQTKLVRYTIVSVERDRERKLEEDEILVTENLTPDGFAAWRIAAYLQRPDHEEIPHEEEKHLRVCHEVLCRWPRESLHYQERQLEELQGIREALEASGSPAPAQPPALGPDERAVLNALGARGGVAATGELAEETGFSRARVRSALETLIAAGRARRTGTGFGTRYELEE